MTLKELNNLPEYEALKQFSICCGTFKWVEQMGNSRPFQNKNELLKRIDKTIKDFNSEMEIIFDELN